MTTVKLSPHRGLERCPQGIAAVGVLGTIALLASGYLALTAIIRERERALSVFAIVFMVLWFLIAVVAILLSGDEA